MRPRTVFFGIMVAAVFTSFAWMGVTSAQTFRTGNNVTVNSNERIDSTLFATGSNIDINSDVDGDIFCAGQTINITSKVSGDIICTGQTITVSGTVTGDVRLAGQTVFLDADVAKNATIGSQAITIRPNSRIGGDLSTASANATISGSVARDVAIAGQSVTLASEIGRNVKGTIENLTLTDGAHVHGNIDYTSSNDLKRDTGARVDGKVTRSEPKGEVSNRNDVFAFRVGWFLYSLLALLFLTFMITLAFPQRIREATAINIRSSWRPLLIGFAASLIVPAVIVTLAITVIGLPIAVLLGLTWLLVLFLSVPIAAYYLGRQVLQNHHHPLAIALIGAAILTLLLFIPILGGLVFLLALWIGSGLILLTLKRYWQPPTYGTKAPAASG